MLVEEDDGVVKDNADGVFKLQDLVDVAQRDGVKRAFRAHRVNHQIAVIDEDGVVIYGIVKQQPQVEVVRRRGPRLILLVYAVDYFFSYHFIVSFRDWLSGKDRLVDLLTRE